MLERHLYSNSDCAAAANVGGVMAARLRESGILSVRWDRDSKRCVWQVFCGGILCRRAVSTEVGTLVLFFLQW